MQELEQEGCEFLKPGYSLIPWHLELLREEGGGAPSARVLSEANTGTDLPCLRSDSEFMLK